MADQILHAIWRSEVHAQYIQQRPDGSYSVGPNPMGGYINFSGGKREVDQFGNPIYQPVGIDYIRSRIRHHHKALVAALALERMFDRETEDADEWVDKMADALYRQSRMDRRPWFEVEEDDPQLAESFRRMASLTRDIYFDEARP